MQETANNPKKNREELKNKRNVLFKLFLKNPMHTRLALEIKALDDQLADWTQLLAQKSETDASSTHMVEHPLSNP
jgi:hypothetical protein